MNNVISLHSHRRAKAAGAFAAVAIAATRMGHSPSAARDAAARASREVLSAVCSPAAAVSRAKAALLTHSTGLSA